MVSFTETPAVLRCSGEEGRSTRGFRRRALTRALRAQSDVVVDLSDLGSTDLTLLVELALLARRLRVRGWTTSLRGAQPQVRRLIELVGVDRMPGVVLDGPGSPSLLA